MDEASIISLIVVAVVAIFSSITAPLLLANRTERMHRQDQLSDYQRQDEVAKTAAETAAAASERDELAAKNNAEAAQVTSDQLEVIHALVNSNLSAAIQAELDALVTSLALMNEVIDLKKASGREPTREVIIALQATETKISELQASLADRAKQAEV